jgi:hypothetical protein
MMLADLAKNLLLNSNADEGTKALAQHAFESAPHEDVLAATLQKLPLPQDVKANLWDAKRQSRLLPADPKVARLAQMAALPKDVLDVAESHPNVAKLLLAEPKSESAKAESKPRGGKSGSQDFSE